MKALILVLSSRRRPWGPLMDESLATWDAVEHPQTQTLYYCAAHSGICPIRPDVFYSTMLDSLENITPRTMEAFERALTIDGWDFLARPNSSCYVHKGNLAAHIDTLPTTGVLRALRTAGEPGVGFLWGGGQFIFSRDVVERMVEHKAQWRNDQMDDIAISRQAELLGLDMYQGATAATINSNADSSFLCLSYDRGENFIFTDFADVGRKAANHFFFRCKVDHDRTMDLRIMRELKEHLL